MWKFLCLGALLVPAAFSASLLEVRSIYILPMGSSLDQYLAQRLVHDGGYEVVADPQRADAVFTDRLGESFERKLDELYPKPDKDENETDSDKDNPPAQVRVGGFSRARGTVFLVDRTTRVVLWSDYVPPPAGSHDDPHKRAENIVNRLRRETNKLRKNQPSATPNPTPAPTGVQ